MSWRYHDGNSYYLVSGLIQKVKAFGFAPVRQKGSHIRFVHPDGRKTTIPDHGNRDAPYGLLLKIIRYDLKMDVKTFFET